MKMTIAVGVMIVAWFFVFQVISWFFMKTQGLDYFFLFR